MSEFLSITRADIAQRLDEISPLVREHDQLAAALKALGDTRPPALRRASPRKQPAQDPAAAMVLEAIRAHPGLRTDQLTQRTGNDAGQHVKALQRAGLIEQLSNGWYSTRTPQATRPHQSPRATRQEP